MSSSSGNGSSGASPGVNVAAVLARFDRSTPENLLTSLAAEIVRLSRESGDLSARVQALEQLQASSDLLLPAGEPAAAPPDLPRSVLIDATHSLLEANGFHPLEFDSAGNPARWTGPSAQFSVPFFIDRRFGGKFKLSFSRFAANVSASFLRCLVDGKPTEITVNDQRGAIEVGGQLTPRADQAATVITFVCPTTASPAQLGQSPDQRQRGLCFQKLTASSNPAPDNAERDPAAAKLARKPRQPE